jgi:hypothetical protein
VVLDGTNSHDAKKTRCGIGKYEFVHLTWCKKMAKKIGVNLRLGSPRAKVGRNL